MLISIKDLDILRNVLKKPLVSKTYPVADTAKILKVSPDTIRRWEKEGKIESIRTAGGHRRFTTEEIQQVKEKNNQPRIEITPSHFSSQSFTKNFILNLKLISFVLISSLLMSIANYPWEISNIINKLTRVSMPGISEEELVVCSRWCI